MHSVKIMPILKYEAFKLIVLFLTTILTSRTLSVLKRAFSFSVSSFMRTLIRQGQEMAPLDSARSRGWRVVSVANGKSAVPDRTYSG